MKLLVRFRLASWATLLTLLHQQQCNALVVPSAIGRPVSPRAAPQLGRLRLGASSIHHQQQQQVVPTMVLSGLPTSNSKKNRVPKLDEQQHQQQQQQQRKKKTAPVTKTKSWEDDLPTTVARAAFSSLKDKARNMMIKGAEKRGLDWTGIVERLQVIKRR